MSPKPRTELLGCLRVHSKNLGATSHRFVQACGHGTEAQTFPAKLVLRPRRLQRLLNPPGPRSRSLDVSTVDIRVTMSNSQEKRWSHERRRKTGGSVLVPEENGAFVLLTWPWLSLGPHANARSGLQS